MLIVGHHILHGKVVTLEKPLAVIVRSSAVHDGEPAVGTSEKSAMDVDDRSSTTENPYFLVTAVIRNKIVFKTRPRPIISNVPKKL